MKRSSRLALAVLCLALAGASAVLYARDVAGRREVLAFAREWGFDVRRPAYFEQISYEPSADTAAGLMADAAVTDEVRPVRWTDLDEMERAAWMDALAQRDEMLKAAHALALSAVAANPGLAFHTWRAGELAYLGERRRGAAALMASRAKWLVPLRHATRLAPGFDGSWQFLAGAFVETWPVLPEDVRAEGKGVLERAFLDPDFARRVFVPAATELGVAEAMALVPDVPGPLAAAQAQVAEGNATAAAALRARWEKAEAKARAEDLAALEVRARMRDEDGLRAGCRSFVGAHPPRELDGAVGQRQAARVLALWPHDRGGSWRGDGRAELLRYFLDGRGEGLDRAAVRRATEALSDVPETERARLALLAGDRYGWERAVRESKTVGSLEWTTFFAELARAELAEGRADEAAEALGRIAPRARGECAVLLAQREWAEAAGDEGAVADVERELAVVRSAPTRPEAWSTAWSLPLCVDPKADGDAGLRIAFAAAAPALVAWEVNGGRRGTLLVGPEGASLDVPLAGLQGVVVVSLPLLAGPRPGLASAERTDAAAAAPNTRPLSTPPRDRVAVAR